ncbi:MAG: galactose oxidase-like domain-containing protein, partial [Pirellulales bacterium]
MKPLGMRLLGLGLLVSSLVGGTMSANAQPAVDGLWTTNFTWGGGGGVEAVHTFLLPTGKVMFWSTWRESVGLWDPVTSQFSTAGNLPAFNPFCSGHAWLPDGRLLVAGGHIFNYDGENRADIYNPFTNRWANADPLQANVPNMGSTSSDPATSGKRWYPSATTLSNGDVLVLSGDVVPINNGGGNTNRTAQIYQPATNTWRTLTGALRPANDLLPEYPRVFQGPDGRAISMSDNSNDTEYLDLAGNGSWSYLQDTLDSNLHNYGPAVMYDTGKIAYIGGGNTPTRNISILDLNATQPAWRYGGGGTTKPPFGSPYVMNRPRRQNNATILADGTVLITGGTDVTGWNDPNGLIATAEIWDPVTEEVTQVASANTNIYRGYHSTALLLPDGRVLVTGGDHDYGGVIPGQNTNAEVFSPAYLFNDDGTPAARPTVTAAPDVAELGDTIFVETPDAASIAKALWVVPGAVTHAQNWTQRANTLDFSISDGGVNIQLPANQNEAPVGYYM